jgi:thymidylate kinase
MSATVPVKGRLIALEGSGGRPMTVAAKFLARELRRPDVEIGSSPWDASDIFFQIAQGARGLPGPSPRTLILLYASDLAFRLRWQIRPALENGATIIAAPYLETAIGFGRAAGLPQPWLRQIFEFAPPAEETFRVPEDTTVMDRRGTTANSFLEFCLAQLRNGPGSWDTEAIRCGCLSHLSRLEARGKCRVVGRHAVAITPNGER